MSGDVCIRDDEKLDELFDGRIRIIQKKDGYRFSLDAILLAHFASLLPATSILDLGTGSGIMPLILARKTGAHRIVGVEVQPCLADMAARTVSLNGLDQRISIVQGDLRELTGRFSPSSFELVVSNPPYYTVDQGRINPHEQKAIARHEIKATVKDIMEAARYLVASSGLVVIIFPAKRLPDLWHALLSNGLKPRTLRIIYSKDSESAKLVVVESCTEGNPELEIAEPFVIYGADGHYSEKMQVVYDGL